MPFTGSHPAAVLPLLRTPLPTSALVIGSMAPDVPYYEPVGRGWPTHSGTGIVTVDLLLGGVVWLVWHALLAAPAVAASPAALRSRLQGRAEPGLAVRLRRTPLVLLALVIGAATHVFWDAFTHPGRLGVRLVPALDTTWAGHAGYAWAQYASGVLGLAALLVAGARWWSRTSPPLAGHGRPAGAGAAPQEGADRARRAAWTVLAATAIVAGVASVLTAPDLPSVPFRGATWTGSATVGCAVVLAVCWHVARRVRPTSADETLAASR